MSHRKYYNYTNDNLHNEHILLDNALSVFSFNLINKLIFSSKSIKLKSILHLQILYR